MNISRVKWGTRGNILLYLAAFSSTVHLESKFSRMVFHTQPGVFDILMRCKCKNKEIYLDLMILDLCYYLIPAKKYLKL